MSHDLTEVPGTGANDIKEFRGFVNEKRLNALSMYFHAAYSADLAENKDRVQKLILDFFETIKDKIPHPSYVIDFYVTSTGKVIVIELNPFVSTIFFS